MTRLCRNSQPMTNNGNETNKYFRHVHSNVKLAWLMLRALRFTRLCCVQELYLTLNLCAFSESRVLVFETNNVIRL